MNTLTENELAAVNAAGDPIATWPVGTLWIPIVPFWFGSMPQVLPSGKPDYAAA